MVSTIDYFLALGFVPDVDGSSDVWRLPSKNKLVDLSIVRGMSLKYGWADCITLYGSLPKSSHGVRYINQDLPPECKDAAAFNALIEYVLGISIEKVKNLVQEAH